MNRHDAVIQAQKVMEDIGLYHHALDDFLRVCRDNELTAKWVNDATEGKCLWVVVTALKLANAAERQVIVVRRIYFSSTAKNCSH